MSKRREKVYIETTIPSYIVAKSSKDALVLSRQRLSKQWWHERRHSYDLFVSPIVMAEVSRGDASQARLRNGLISSIPSLNLSPEIERLAARYMKHFGFPRQALYDSLHLALAVHHRMDFLLTWNCKHLANASVRHELNRINNHSGYTTPDLCTPEELLPLEDI